MTEQAQQFSEMPLADLEESTIRRWNWGAFTFSWIWAFGMRSWIWAMGLLAHSALLYRAFYSWDQSGLTVDGVLRKLTNPDWPTWRVTLSLALLKLVWGLVLAIVVAGPACWLGVFGNRIAWNSKGRKWDDLLHFRVTQMAWERYGRPIAIMVLTIVPMYFLLLQFSSLQGGGSLEGGGHQH